MAASDVISLRMSPQDRNLIDLAAEAAHKSRTEFMLDSARAAAADALLDRRLFVLEAAAFKVFAKALDKAPTSATVLRGLKKRRSPWKK